MVFSRELKRAATEIADSPKLSQIAITALAEGSEEVTQEALSQYSLNDYDMQQLIVSGVAGALGGAVLAAPTIGWKRADNQRR